MNNKIENLNIDNKNFIGKKLTNNLIRKALIEYDQDTKKAESVFQLYGQSFDSVKKYIDNIAHMRNVSYDGVNNVPDVLLKNLSNLYFVDSCIGYLVAGADSIYKTSDCGLTFQLQRGGTNSTYLTVNFVNENVIVVLSFNFIITFFNSFLDFEIYKTIEL